jgi:hypothetical protein
MGLTLAAQTNDLYELHLVLRNALTQQGDQNQYSPHLLLDLSRRDGVWWPVRGYALTFNQGSHMGVVLNADISDSSTKVEILMNIGGDQWIPGGYGRYVVTLGGKDANGRMTGTYEGAFRDRPFKGVVSGTVRPPRPIRVPDFVPMEKGEHPRILLRKADLPKFREKLKTRFGQDTIEYFKTMPNSFVALAFLYAATGEKPYAEKAIPLIDKKMLEFSGGAKAVDAWYDRQPSIALASDLMWDALPPDFIARVYDYADRIAEATCNKMGLFGSGFNFNPCSNWFAPVAGAGGTLALLLYGEPGPEPQKPLGLLGASTEPGSDAIGKMVSKYSDPKLATAAANDLAWKTTFWQTEYDVWKQTGCDVKKLFLFDQVGYQNYKHLRIGIGDGGFQSEVGAYPGFCHQTVLWFAAQHRMVLGRDISPYPDATHFLPRHMMSGWYGDNGRHHAMPINGNAGLGGLVMNQISLAFPICPDEWKPSLLWAWNHLAKITHGDESTYINAVKTGGFFGNGTIGQVAAFFSYPLDMKPVHPKETMPRTWQAPTRGMYLFRSGWEGKDEFICQTFVKATPIGGNSQANAGSFKIWGLQREWVTGHDGKKDVRQNLPLVDFPDYAELSTNVNSEYHAMNLFGCGILQDLTTEPDGSGTISIDMNEVYGRPKLVKVAAAPAVAAPEPTGRVLTARQLRDRIKKEEAPPKREQFIDANFVRQNSEFDPVCIKGLRAFAFDFSGKAGVPCVAVAVDRIEGGKRKVWRIPPPPVLSDGNSRTPGHAPIVFTNNGFVVTHPDGASMQAVFLAPSKAAAAITTESIDKDKRAEVDDSVATTAITVTGPTGEEGDFFVVMTFTRGLQPKIASEGSGLNAKISVGQRTYRFDGKRVLME